MHYAVAEQYKIVFCLRVSAVNNWFFTDYRLRLPSHLHILGQVLIKSCRLNFYFTRCQVLGCAYWIMIMFSLCP